MQSLRSEFPVLERIAYLNAGTAGPVPARAVEAVERALRRQADEGRGDRTAFERILEADEALRTRVARMIGASPEEVTVTGATTDGINSALLALDLQAGDEVVTSDEEHPGLLAPLAIARDRRGIDLRVVPFDELANAVRPTTRLVACSHVSWMTGRVADVAALAATDATLLLDGAQGLGAVPVDVRELGCDFYAASGQKWMCGPNGLGYLYARADVCAELTAPWPGYHVLEDPHRALDSAIHQDARRLGTGPPALHQLAFALAALDVFEAAGLDRVQQAAIDGAARLATELTDRGLEVAPRGASTLVSFAAPDPEGFVADAAAAGVTVRFLPNTPYVRASVGGWSNEDDLGRLLELAAP